MKEETMQAAIVEEAGEISVKKVEVPEPAENEVRVEVRASGVCHSDEATVEGHMPVDYPRIPGHEIAGVVEETGPRVDKWEEGDRVAAGWHGGHCFDCDNCRRGRFLKCESQEINGVTRDGGHAEFVNIREEALARIPDSMNFRKAATLMCAGLTTFNALRTSDLNPGERVAVLGIGGLGHLGVQFASQAGFETYAVSRQESKLEDASEMGADHLVNSTQSDISDGLEEIGGADLVLSTAPSRKAMEETIQGLAVEGELKILGLPGTKIEVSPQHLVQKNASVSGHSSGRPIDAEKTLEFAQRNNVEPEIEVFDLSEYEKAYRKMMDGEVRYRAVLEP